MGFKFFQKEEIQHNNFIVFNNAIIDRNNVEFCFQFGDEEPVSFATGPNECVITINPTHDGNIIFNNNGRVFKLFARERQ